MGKSIRKLKVGDTISYIGLSTQTGGGETRMKQYSHGHIGVFKKFAKERKVRELHVWLRSFC
jgi:hypothetical protein